MCGIVAILNVKQQTQALRDKALRMSGKIRHRGPDWSGIYCGGSAVLAHERLSIVDPESGGQPLFSSDRRQVLAVNGEIYNHQEIRRRYAGSYDFQTGSDCEVILSLYRDKGIDFLEDLNGIFAFVLYDEERDEFSDSPRPNRCDTFVYRPRQRRDGLCGFRTESSGGTVRKLRTVFAGALLLERHTGHEAILQSRLDGI